MKRFVIAACPLLLAALNSCLTERTVTDGSGQVIYRDTEVHSPFDSERQKLDQVRKKELQMGYDDPGF